MKVLRWLGSQLFPLWAIVWVNAVVVRVSVKDSVDLFAPLYYATPWPVLMVLSLPLIWIFRRQPLMVFGAIVVVHVCLAMWIMEDWRREPPGPGPADLRVVQWNVARPARRFDGIAKCLHQYDADVITIAEALPTNARGKERWHEAFPDYKREFSPGDMLLLVRGEVVETQTGVIFPSSYYSIFTVRVKEHTFRVMQVDVNGVPNQSRKPPLQGLADLAESLSDLPLIISGDFNTPRDSVHFEPLRKTMVNAFEKVGFGSGETWPMPFPVLSLDHIWSNSQIIPIRCRHDVSFRSDHRAVVAELKFAP